MSQTSDDNAVLRRGLLDFIRISPTPFHAVRTMSTRLEQAGFMALDEGEAWELRPGGRYYVCRNESSIIAFTLGEDDVADSGFSMAGAHTDSPCLKIKPQPVMKRTGTVQLGVEVYGGALLAPWFDRDLAIAGRVDYRNAAGDVRSGLIDSGRPVAVIPSLAIHLDREANQNRSINAQKDLPPLLCLQTTSGSEFSLEQWLLQQLHGQAEHDSAERVLAHELSLYDTQAPALTGLHEEFISAARLDNLLSCHVAMEALIEAEPGHFSLVVCNDHEEVGSASACGAQGPFLESVLGRIVESGETRGAHRERIERIIRRSLFLSVDNAHAIHPNFADRHDGNHGPLLNHGPVIKINANQRYASNSHSTARFMAVCEQAGVPVQSFVMRSDMACGSTIGPITASGIGVDTVDVGVPTFAMHSIRELAGSEDAGYLYRALLPFFSGQG
ncbi:MAG: M18 family aminopeptidase [Pseudohongiellaceae bacterium]